MANKRGLSEVVATVMIILLTVVAISVIAAFIVPFVRNSLQKSTECINYRDYFSFDETFGLNCYQGNLAGVSIKAAGEGNLAADVKGFKLVVASKDGSSKGANVQKVVYGDANDDGKFDLLNSDDLNAFSTLFQTNKLPSPGTELFIALDVNGDEKITGDIVPDNGDDLETITSIMLGKIARFPVETMAGHVRMLGENGKIDIPAGGETISYVYNATGSGELLSASIYPLLKSGRVCSEGDTVQLSACGAEVTLT